jgi:drug/metabolite transporter (DMT)-like permease
MDRPTFLMAIAALLSWGVSAFVSKLAANRIGERAVLWDMLGYIPVIIVFSLIAFKVKDYIGDDRIGIVLALISGAIGSVGMVAFYTLLTRKDASVAIPLTALYPALAAILAFLFLHEKMTTVRIAGIAVATLAVYLLSL